MARGEGRGRYVGLLGVVSAGGVVVVVVRSAPGAQVNQASKGAVVSGLCLRMARAFSLCRTTPRNCRILVATVLSSSPVFEDVNLASS